MNGLNTLEKLVETAAHDAKAAGYTSDYYGKAKADLKELKSLLSKLMRATNNGDIHPHSTIGPGMQAEITSVAKEIDAFLNK